MFAAGVEHASRQCPTAKATVNSKKVANNATDAPKHDKNASRNPDNMDEGVTGVPQVPQWNKKDTCQKKRRMYHIFGAPFWNSPFVAEHAPVTVPESNESEEDAQIKENDEEDKGNEQVIENGTEQNEHIPMFYYSQ